MLFWQSNYQLLYTCPDWFASPGSSVVGGCGKIKKFACGMNGRYRTHDIVKSGALPLPDFDGPAAVYIYKTNDNDKEFAKENCMA
ncbi:MAG TPA: hypothetical protein DD733_00610 [Clostridiales bacterium]|nr:hypothetical protein [Clostridiales bacterium]